MSTVIDKKTTTKKPVSATSKSKEPKSFYEITYQMELLNELAASIAAQYFHYKQKNEISNEDTDLPVVKKCIRVWELKRQILDCKTLEELAEIKNELLMLNDYIEACEVTNNA